MGQPQTRAGAECRRAWIEAFCGRYGVSLLYSFGSRGQRVREWLDAPAGGGAHRAALAGRADVDVGVRPEPGVHWTVRDKVRMAIALEDLLGCRRVDLVVLPEADPFVAVEIIRGERLFAQDEYAADEYELYVLRRAGDLIPLERERMALVLGEAL